MMVDKDMTEDICEEVVSGKPSPLLSNFKLTYYTLLNLLRRVDGPAEQKKVIGVQIKAATDKSAEGATDEAVKI